MNQVLGWTLCFTTGAIGFAAADGEYLSVSLGVVVVGFIAWHLKRQRDEREKL